LHERRSGAELLSECHSLGKKLGILSHYIGILEDTTVQYLEVHDNNAEVDALASLTQDMEDSSSDGDEDEGEGAAHHSHAHHTTASVALEFDLGNRMRKSAMQELLDHLTDSRVRLQKYTRLMHDEVEVWAAVHETVSDEV
jgi:G3E family GTPase